MEWISVKDRLPEVDQGILLYWNDDICTGYLTKYGNDFIFCDGFTDDYEKEFVTHWMPLPEPPKN